MSEGLDTFPIIMFLSSTVRFVVSMVGVVPLTVRLPLTVRSLNVWFVLPETVRSPVIVTPAEVVSSFFTLS